MSGEVRMADAHSDRRSGQRRHDRDSGLATCLDRPKSNRKSTGKEAFMRHSRSARRLNLVGDRNGKTGGGIGGWAWAP
jgi:hypothetical protein